MLYEISRPKTGEVIRKQRTLFKEQFFTALFTCYYGDLIDNDAVDGSCSTHEVKK
jgi:hypothetical protein